MTERFQQKNISVPDGIWIMRQTWNDVLFAHWPVDVSILRALVPSVLELDTYNGQASFLKTPNSSSSSLESWESVDELPTLLNS